MIYRAYKLKLQAGLIINKFYLVFIFFSVSMYNVYEIKN